MVEVKVTESGGMNPRIKEGTYPVRLAGIVERVLDVKDDITGEVAEVPRFEWIFGLRTGEGDKRFTALTSLTFSTKSKAFSFAKALRDGKALEIGKSFNTDTLNGLYATAVIVDKIPKKADRLGQITVSSEITVLTPIAAMPDPEIEIEGLLEEVTEDQEPETTVLPPALPTPPPVPPVPDVKKKSKK